jgi:uncharacterized membrane protein YkvA (DUF1232 family)
MAIDITFSLSDDDLKRFQEIADKAREKFGDAGDEQSIINAARDLAKDPATDNLPDFIADRLSKIGTLVDMLEDKEWSLEGEDRERVLAGLAYFAHTEDLIDDTVPGLGFLDDAIYVEIAIQDLHAEIESYDLFCDFRRAEEKRHANRGEDTYVTREEWLKDQRAVLLARMRRRRSRFRL